MAIASSYCPSCMQPAPGGAAACPHCGKSLRLENQPHQLPVGTVLSGRYLIGRVIGEGGFGITYVGRDLKLDMMIAVKEFYPAGAATRYHGRTLEVSTSYADGDRVFSEGRAKFLDEARALAKFANDPNIVCVRDYFEENATAYIVMEYLDGESLMDALKRRGPYRFDELFPMLEPVMQALGRMHRKGLIHRDISPSNLMLMKDGRVKLLDFGTARDVNPDGEKSLSVVLKPGFAPVEQYQSHGSQGPWTDVYALCASIYKLLTGTTPVNSMNRLFREELPLPSACGASISPGQEAVLMKGLSVRQEQRLQSMEELAAAFRDPSLLGARPADAEEITSSGADLPAPPPAPPVSVPEDDALTSDGSGLPTPPVPPEPKPPKKPRREKSGKRKSWLLPALIAAVVLLAVPLLLFFAPEDSHIYSKDSSFANYYDEEVTLSSLRAVNRAGHVTSLNMNKCRISDEAIAYMAKMKGIEQLQLDSCTGFTSLDALADAKSLQSLGISGNALEDSGSPFDASLLTADFPQVTYLNLSYLSFADQGAFLEHFPALTSLRIAHGGGTLSTAHIRADALQRLHLSGVTVPDFAPLSRLTALEYVELNGLGMADCVWAEPLSSLRSLQVRDNRLTDLRGLRDHAQLSTLEASGNSILDLSELSGCTALKELDLENNSLWDLSVLAELSALKELNLAGNQVADLAPLAGCTALTSLRLSDNPLADSDMSPLAGCTALQYLYLDRCGAADLSFCERLIDLRTLYAADNGIEDLSGLINTTQLEQLDLSGNAITDLSPVAKNTEHLESVRLRGNQIADFSPLAGCANLALITLDGNEATELDFLSGCVKLSYLSAAGNHIADISGLSGCVLLQYTDLGENEIEDITPLSSCVKDNQILMLQHNQIRDISLLPETVDYKLLSLYGNPIEDFSKLTYMKAVSTFSSYLYLSWVEGLGSDALAPYPAAHVSVVDTPIDRQAPLKTAYKDARRELGSISGELSFPGPDEADADMETVREKAHAEEGNASSAIRISNLF